MLQEAGRISRERRLSISPNGQWLTRRFTVMTFRTAWGIGTLAGIQVAAAAGGGTDWSAVVTLAAVRRRTAFRISAATMIDRATAVQMSHCLTSSVVVFRIIWNGRRTVDMTSRKKDNPVVMMNVRSEKVSRENADCRSSFASIEKLSLIHI